MADKIQYKTTEEVVDAILERCGQIAAALWEHTPANPVFLDMEDITLDEAYEVAYVEIMKAIVENHIVPNKFGMAFMGKEEGDA